MKKTILSMIILTITGLVNAQTFSIGPTAGFRHSWVGNTGGNTKFNPMWNAGLSFIYSTKTNFGIGADVKYSAEGNKIKTQITGPADGLIDVKSTVNANYIRIPVKLIYFFGKYGNTIRPKIYAGPDLGFLTSAKAVYEYSDGDVKTDVKDYVKGFDFGVTAAAGLNFRLASKTWLNTDLAFYQGLSNTTKNEGTTQHNGNLGLNVGLLIGL